MHSTAASSPLSWLSDTVRRPEVLVERWSRRHEGPAPSAGLFFVLALSGALGLAMYGVTMGLPHGLEHMGRVALLVPLSAVIAWSLCLPSLYVIYAALGASLGRSTVLLAALATFCFGSIARLASAPLSWFFGIALPVPALLTGLHLLVFGVTALAMLATFVRVMRTLAPRVPAVVPLVWLVCVGLIDAELKALLSVFVF